MFDILKKVVTVPLNFLTTACKGHPGKIAIGAGLFAAGTATVLILCPVTGPLLVALISVFGVALALSLISTGAKIMKDAIEVELLEQNNVEREGDREELDRLTAQVDQDPAIDLEFLTQYNTLRAQYEQLLRAHAAEQANNQQRLLALQRIAAQNALQQVTPGFFPEAPQTTRQEDIEISLSELEISIANVSPTPTETQSQIPASTRGVRRFNFLPTVSSSTPGTGQEHTNPSP